MGRSLHVQCTRSVASPNNMLLFYFSYKLVERHCNHRGQKKGSDNLDDFLLFLVSVQLRISLNPGPRYAIQGSNFTLPTCHGTGYPTPIVTWRKLSSDLPRGRVGCNNGTLQISQVRKEDSDVYTCSAKNLLGNAEKKTMLVVVSLPQFTSKPPSKIVSMLSFTVKLNCSKKVSCQLGEASRSLERWLLQTCNRVTEGITFALLQVLACSLSRL